MDIRQTAIAQCSFSFSINPDTGVMTYEFCKNGSSVASSTRASSQAMTANNTNFGAANFASEFAHITCQNAMFFSEALTASELLTIYAL